MRGFAIRGGRVVGNLENRWNRQIRGFLQADTFGGYDGIYAGGKVVEVGCNAHAQRKFIEAQKTDLCAPACRCRSWFVATLTMLVIAGTTRPNWAWGRLGHRVISRLAEQRLTPKAKAAIAELLEPGESLADASMWADEYKRGGRHTV